MLPMVHLILLCLRACLTKKSAGGFHYAAHNNGDDDHNGKHKEKDVQQHQLIQRDVLPGGPHVPAAMPHHVIQPPGSPVHGHAEQLSEEEGGLCDGLSVAGLASHSHYGGLQLLRCARAQVHHFSEALDPKALCVVGLVTEHGSGHDGHGVVQSLVLTVLAAVADEHLGVGVTHKVVLRQPVGGQDLGRVGRGQVGPEDGLHGQL